MIYTNGIGGADWADTPMTFITAQLALGNQFDPEQHSAHFDAVLDCAAEVPLFPSKPGHHLPLKDADSVDPGALAEALDQQLAQHRVVLVYCGSGVSRSVAVLCGYLALKSGRTTEVMLKSVQALRPQASPSAFTLRSVALHVESTLRHR